MTTPEKYYPANGTDGMIFTSEFCDRCYKRYGCSILMKSLVGIEPKQWVYENSEPICTSFNPNRPARKKVSKVNTAPKLF
jgi:hypothetical protein